MQRLAGGLEAVRIELLHLKTELEKERHTHQEELSRLRATASLGEAQQVEARLRVLLDAQRAALVRLGAELSAAVAEVGRLHAASQAVAEAEAAARVRRSEEETALRGQIGAKTMQLGLLAADHSSVCKELSRAVAAGEQERKARRVAEASLRSELEVRDMEITRLGADVEGMRCKLNHALRVVEMQVSRTLELGGWTRG